MTLKEFFIDLKPEILTSEEIQEVNTLVSAYKIIYTENNVLNPLQ